MADDNHPLMQPRIIMAVSLVGVWGIGVGLLSAHVYWTLGAFLCLLPPIGVISLYIEQSRKAFKALSRTDYSIDIRPIELIIAFAIVAAMLPFSLYMIYDNINYEDKSLPKSALEIISTGSKQDTSIPFSYYLSLNYINNGKISSSLPKIREIGQYISEGDPNEPAFSKLVDQMLRNVKKDIPDDGNEIYAGQILKQPIDLPVISADDFQRFQKGQGYIYVIVAMKYSDENLPAHKFRYTQYCIFIKNSMTEQHPCVKGNRITTQ